MELSLYNTVLTSMSADGKKFTYDNQLASSENSPSKREEWFQCACCPPNVTRLLGQIGGYIWDHRSSTKEESAEIVVNLYVPSKIAFDVGKHSVNLVQESDWPWKGDIKFTLQTTLPKVSVKLRIPGWAKSYKVCRWLIMKSSVSLRSLAISWMSRRSLEKGLPSNSLQLVVFEFEFYTFDSSRAAPDCLSSFHESEHAIAGTWSRSLLR